MNQVMMNGFDRSEKLKKSGSMDKGDEGRTKETEMKLENLRWEEKQGKE